MPSIIHKVIHKLNSQDGFLKSVSVLAGGTAFAQAIGILILPIVTRLYTPEEFALFAVYASLLGILSVATCLRFEIAIPLPEKDEDAFSLFIIAILSNISVTILLIALISFFSEKILDIIQQPQLAPFIWFIPIGVFFAGVYNALQYWTTRKKQFSTIAKTRMTQSLSSSTAQVGGGYFELGALGLIIGQIINFSAGILRLSIIFWHENRELVRKVTVAKLKKNWKKYDKFPKYSTFESLANIGAIQLPVIIIAAVALGPEAGYLMLAMKVMAVPMSLIGTAIGQVYLAHAPEHYKKGELKQYTIQTIRQIAKIAVFPLVVLGCLAPYIFPIVFGSAWTEAGYMLFWMVPWFVMQIISSPVSMSLHITNNQEIAFFLQVAGLIFRVGGLLLVSVKFSDWSFKYYAISGFIFYLLYLIVIIKVLDRK